MYIPAVGPGCGEGFLGCIRNGMPAALKRASNFTASRGAYVPSSTKSVCSGLSDFMRGFRRQFVVYFCRHRSKFAGEDRGRSTRILRQDPHAKISVKNYMSDKIVFKGNSFLAGLLQARRNSGQTAIPLRP